MKTSPDLRFGALIFHMRPGYMRRYLNGDTAYMPLPCRTLTNETNADKFVKARYDFRNVKSIISRSSKGEILETPITNETGLLKTGIYLQSWWNNGDTLILLNPKERTDLALDRLVSKIGQVQVTDNKYPNYLANLQQNAETLSAERAGSRRSTDWIAILSSQIDRDLAEAFVQRISRTRKLHAQLKRDNKPIKDVTFIWNVLPSNELPVSDEVNVPLVPDKVRISLDLREGVDKPQPPKESIPVQVKSAEVFEKRIERPKKSFDFGAFLANLEKDENGGRPVLKRSRERAQKPEKNRK